MSALHFPPGRMPCSMEFVTKQIAPLLPDSPFEKIIKFKYIAWGNALWNNTQVAGRGGGCCLVRCSLADSARRGASVRGHRGRLFGVQHSAELEAYCEAALLLTTRALPSPGVLCRRGVCSPPASMGPTSAA